MSCSLVLCSGSTLPKSWSLCTCTSSSILFLSYFQAVACWCKCRFVHAQLLNDSNISLTFHMSGGGRPRGVDCIPLQLSRHLEMRVAEAEGLLDVRHWLQLLGSHPCCQL